MPYDIDSKLVVGIASSALFDLSESDAVYRDQGVDAYRAYSRDQIEQPLSPGAAFPFIRRLLSLNELNPEQPPIEVIFLSRNDPDTGQRLFLSAIHHGLSITRGAFLAGKSPYPYIEAFNASLFLSGNHDDVADAVAKGLPAGLILGNSSEDDPGDAELRVAFDFDGVLADDEAEAVYQSTNDLNAFYVAETEKSSIPHNPGPLHRLFRQLTRLQETIGHPAGETRPGVRIAIITARSSPAHGRVITTLREWGVQPDETFFLGGIEKRRILQVYRPHMFFDDQASHLERGSEYGAMVHIPFGIANTAR